MARSYKRDKNGQFASTGSSGGSSRYSSRSAGKAKTPKALTGDRTYVNKWGKATRENSVPSKFDKTGVRATGIVSGDVQGRRAQNKSMMAARKNSAFGKPIKRSPKK